MNVLGGASGWFLDDTSVLVLPVSRLSLVVRISLHNEWKWLKCQIHVNIILIG